MEKRSTTATGTADELAIVKAAAWAWYVRGSGCERKISHEFCIYGRGRAVGPSRYKLEALRDDEHRRLRRDPCPLVNSHEVDRISMKLGCVLRSKGEPYDNHRSSLTAVDDPARRMKVRKLNGFWLRHAIGMCTSRRDMVETKTRRQRI